MNILFFAVVFSILTFANDTTAGEIKPDGNYICISEQAVGFVQKNGKWNSTVFNNANEKYYFKFDKILEKDNEGHFLLSRYTFKEFGSEYETECKKTFLGDIHCPTIGVTMATQTMRYNAVYKGFINDSLNKNSTKESTNNPYIEIGSCSTL